jgi:hypothetical protein
VRLLTFTFSNCNSVDVSHAAITAGYGSGNRAAVRLTDIASVACIDGTPAAKTNGAWVEAAPPPAYSELAATVVGGKIYAQDGFGNSRAFKRYDPAPNTWARLPDLPAGRDHPAAFSFSAFSSLHDRTQLNTRV